MSVVYDHLRPSAAGVVIGATVFSLARYLGHAPVVFSVVGSYIAVYIGERGHRLSDLIARYGDISYGLYLYGWPCEQMVVQLTGTRSPWTIFFGSLMPAVVLALFSFHLIEKRAMMFRKVVAQFISSRWDAILVGDRRSQRFAELGARFFCVLCSVWILLSGSQWWFVLESSAIITASAAGGAALGYVIGRLTGTSVATPGPASA